MSKKINSDEFNKEVIESRGLAFVDFYADWCGPCKMLSPVMDEISDSYSVYKINVDEESKLASEYGIMSIPCVILFKDGKEYKRSVGLKTKEEILEMID